MDWWRGWALLCRPPQAATEVSWSKPINVWMYDHLMLVECCITLCDAGLTLIQHWIDVCVCWNHDCYFKFVIKHLKNVSLYLSCSLDLCNCYCKAFDLVTLLPVKLTRITWFSAISSSILNRFSWNFAKAIFYSNPNSGKNFAKSHLILQKLDHLTCNKILELV